MVPINCYMQNVKFVIPMLGFSVQEDYAASGNQVKCQRRILAETTGKKTRFYMKGSLYEL